MIPMRTNSMTYNEFLHSKMAIAEKSGFKVPDSEIHPALKPHQRAAVRWALEGGREAAIILHGSCAGVMEYGCMG